MKNIKLTLTALGIGIVFLGISSYSTLEYIDTERRNKIFSEYSELECEQMKDKFDSDLKNDELKYFSGGMFYDIILVEELEKHGIEDFYQGCMVSGKLRCYSELVSDYLKKEKNVDLLKLYE